MFSKLATHDFVRLVGLRSLRAISSALFRNHVLSSSIAKVVKEDDSVMARGGKQQLQQQQRSSKKKTKEKKQKRMKSKEATQIAEERVIKWAGAERLTPGCFDLHAHSTCSDGLLSPELLVHRAFRNGVRVLALTDHDTMAGVPSAVQAARQHGIRVIPGIEISAKNVTTKAGSGKEEPVHILAYYGCCGPSNRALLEERLTLVQQGRYRRAQEMVDKLRALHLPIALENVLKIAGEGVAPGRPHVARALVEAGHVASEAEAFNKYLHNSGPAYAAGAELPAEEAVRLILQTGGVSALAHPWTLSDPMPVIKRLKAAGLHAMEVYRGDGRTAYADVAELSSLVKLGGSDYHSIGTSDETDLGGVALPLLAFHEFLKLAEPLWRSATEKIIHDFAELSHRTAPAGSFADDAGVVEICPTNLTLIEEGQSSQKSSSLVLSPWLSEEERDRLLLVASDLGLNHILTTAEGRTAAVLRR